MKAPKLPVKPGKHWHMKSAMRSWQIPPFKQGLLPHSSTFASQRDPVNPSTHSQSNLKRLITLIKLRYSLPHVYTDKTAL